LSRMMLVWPESTGVFSPANRTPAGTASRSWFIEERNAPHRCGYHCPAGNDVCRTTVPPPWRESQPAVLAVTATDSTRGASSTEEREYHRSFLYVRTSGYRGAWTLPTRMPSEAIRRATASAAVKSPDGKWGGIAQISA